MLRPANVVDLPILRALIREGALTGSFDRSLATESRESTLFFNNLRQALASGYFVEPDPRTGDLATVGRACVRLSVGRGPDRASADRVRPVQGGRRSDTSCGSRASTRLGAGAATAAGCSASSSPRRRVARRISSACRPTARRARRWRTCSVRSVTAASAKRRGSRCTCAATLPSRFARRTRRPPPRRRPTG